MASWSGFLRRHGVSGSGLGELLGGVVLAILVVTAVWSGLPLLLPEQVELIRAALVPCLGIAFAGLLLLSARSLRRGALLQAWADKRGMRYVHRRRSRSAAPWEGTPFPRTGGYFVRHHLIGSGFETARYRSMPDGTGYHSAGLVDSFTFVRFELPHPVPHLVVTSRRSSTLNAAGLAISSGRALRGSLEFDSSFTLHCPADYERDALYVFTPDLLALIIDVAPGCDLELIDTTAYLYLSREPKLWREQVADELLTLVELLRHKLDRQTRRYRDDRVPGNTDGATRVAFGGRRLALRRSMRGRAIALAVGLPGFVLAAVVIARFLRWIPL